MEDMVEIKTNINDLKTNVDIIKDDMKEMKHGMTNAVEKISTAMTSLATLTEKISYNTEDHKVIHKRIDQLHADNEENKEIISVLKSSHDSCIERRKLEEENKKNSFWKKCVERAIEYLFIVIVIFVLFTLFSHFKEFITYFNNTGNANPIHVK